MVAASGLGGCSYPLLTLGTNDDVTTTATVAPASGQPVRLADASGPAELDLAYARAAAENALARGGKDLSVPWQNPQTGAGGNITPLQSSYTEAGLPCRDFLASYIHGAAQDWLRGAACRDAHGVWQIKRLKPLTSG